MKFPVVYITRPVTGKVHLWYERSTRTVCGLKIDDTWPLGDETVSGHRSDCERCRRFYDQHR